MNLYCYLRSFVQEFHYFMEQHFGIPSSITRIQTSTTKIIVDLVFSLQKNGVKCLQKHTSIADMKHINKAN